MPIRVFYLLGLVFLTGCGPRLGTVAGTVRFKGEPVPSGTVSFIAGGNLYEGEIQDGRYEVTGVPPGGYVITVIRVDPSQPDPVIALSNARKQMIDGKALNPKEIDPNVVTDPAQLNSLQKKRHLLPFSYSSSATSTLRFTVTGRQNAFDIEL